MSSIYLRRVAAVAFLASVGNKFQISMGPPAPASAEGRPRGEPGPFFRLMRACNLARVLGLILALLPVAAGAQNLGNLPANSVVARGAVPAQGGPWQAIPFTQLIASLLSGGFTTSTMTANSVVFKGSSSGQATVSAQAAAGTPTLKLPTISGTFPSSASTPILLDPVTGIISCPTCATSTAAATPIVASRTLAQTLNLSGFTGLVSAGYATAGDGGRATFVNVGSAPFIDSNVTSTSITAGSGCTNGTYYGVQPSGGTGRGFIAVITVAGGIVTADNFIYSPGNAYSVGDVLALPSTAVNTSSGTLTCSNAALVVTGVSTPLGSFSEASGTHFQIVNEYAVNVKQFGAVGDFNGTTGTDNLAALQAANFFANYKSVIIPGQAGKGHWGGRVTVPNGSYYICGAGTTSLEIPQGVIFEGSSYQGATINGCSTWNQSTNMVELCDPNWHFTCLGAGARDIVFTMSLGATQTGFTAVVHSNNDQDFGGLKDVYVYSDTWPCVHYEEGYGGASTFSIWHLSCSTASAQAQIIIGNTSGSGLNLGSTSVVLDTIVLGGPSGGGVYQTGPGIFIFGGFVSVKHAHCEEMPTCVEVNNTATIASGMTWLEDINSFSNSPAPACTGVITLVSTNTPGNMIASMIPQAGSCPNTITNAQSGGGISFTGTIAKPITCLNPTCS